MNWFERLESQLNDQLETFLSSNPKQKKLLDQEELEERQAKLLKRQLSLRKEAELLQKELVDLAPRISYWKNKLENAQKRKQWELIEEASIHQKELMYKGNTQWHVLKELEFELKQLNHTLTTLKEIADHNYSSFSTQDSRKSNYSDKDWGQFDTRQELEYLRRYYQK